VNKKILFVLHLPPPVHGSSLVGSFIKDSTLINTSFNSKYINLGTSKSIDEIGKNGLNKWILYFKLVFMVIKQFIVYKPNLVYLAMTANGIAFYKDMVIAFLAKLFGVPLVIHFHNKGVSINQNKTLDNFLYKLVFKNTKVIMLSKHLFPDIKKYVKKDDVYYCPNGIPEIGSNENNVTIKNDTAQLLFLSNLIESKGVYVLLEALSILKSKAISFSCNFVGGIGDITEETFSNKVSSLQLQDCVQYLGKKFNQEKTDIFKRSDIFVLPTFYHNECFPLVLLEASQFKLPMVSTFEGAIPEIIDDGVNGFLVPKKDARALADKLEALIKNESLRTNLGQEAYKKYENEYTLTQFESNMRSILKSINEEKN
jgi:glycosyltransferase involved in cell wall biosynthesis